VKIIRSKATQGIPRLLYFNAGSGEELAFTNRKFAKISTQTGHNILQLITLREPSLFLIFSVRNKAGKRAISHALLRSPADLAFTGVAAQRNSVSIL
jgi:hypothetical protein